MRLSNLADYAIVLMSTAARHCGVRFGGLPLQAVSLSQETGIPAPTVHKLITRLAGAGLLVSSRGSGGGVRLARPAAVISLAEIIEAIDGPIAITSCSAGGRHDCSLEATCNVQPRWVLINRAVRDAFAKVSLAQFALPAGGVRAAMPPPRAPIADIEHMPPPQAQAAMGTTVGAAMGSTMGTAMGTAMGAAMGAAMGETMRPQAHNYGYAP